MTASQPLFTATWGPDPGDGQEERLHMVRGLKLHRQGRCFGRLCRDAALSPKVQVAAVLKAWGCEGAGLASCSLSRLMTSEESLKISEAFLNQSFWLSASLLLFLDSLSLSGGNISDTSQGTQCWSSFCHVHFVLPSCPGDVLKVPVLLLPFPRVFLMMMREWSDVLLLLRWHRAFNLYNKCLQGPLSQWCSAQTALGGRDLGSPRPHPQALTKL